MLTVYSFAENVGRGNWFLVNPDLGYPGFQDLGHYPIPDIASIAQIALLAQVSWLAHMGGQCVRAGHVLHRCGGLLRGCQSRARLPNDQRRPRGRVLRAPMALRAGHWPRIPRQLHVGAACDRPDLIGRPPSPRPRTRRGVHPPRRWCGRGRRRQRHLLRPDDDCVAGGGPCPRYRPGAACPAGGPLASPLSCH